MGKYNTHDDHYAPPEDIVVRVKALENLMLEKGLIDLKAMDEPIDRYEHKIGPHIGSRVVAEVGAPKNRGEGVFPFPDKNAHGGSAAEHVYLVRFSAQAIWGLKRPLETPCDWIYGNRTWN
jgi:hypothetical protein